MIKLVVHTGVFLAKSVALNFTDVNECTNGTSTADGETCNGKIEPNLRV